MEDEDSTYSHEFADPFNESPIFGENIVRNRRAKFLYH